MAIDALPFVFTPDQAYAAGWTPDRLRRAVRRGDLVRLGRRAYAAAETVTACRSSPEGRLRLRSAAATRSTKRLSWASHESALVLHGIPPGRSVPSRAVVTVDDKCGIVHRRATYDLWPAQLPTLHRTDVAGIPTVSAARAVVDRCRHVEFRDCLIVGDAALHLGRSTPTEIHEAIDFCTGWAGVRGARTAAAYFDGKRESPLESLSYAAFVQHGLPLPACQVPIVDDWGELLGIVDFYWRELGVIGEADGRLKYRRSRDGRQPRPTTLLGRSTDRNSSRIRRSSCVGAGQTPRSRTAYHSFAASRRRFVGQPAGSDWVSTGVRFARFADRLPPVGVVPRAICRICGTRTGGRRAR